MEIALSPWAQVSLVIIAAVNVLFLGVLAAAAFMGIKEFKKLRGQIQPLIDHVNPLLDAVRPVVAAVPPILDHQVKPILGTVHEVALKVRDNVEPTMGTVRDIARNVNGIIADVGTHVHSIAETGEHTVKEITHRVEATGQVVTDTVTKPVIGAAGFFAGIARAFSVLKNYQNDGATPEHARANGDGATSASSNLS